MAGTRRTFIRWASLGLGPRSWARLNALALALALAAVVAVGAGAACSPVYVTKASLAQLEILGDRRPLAEVAMDPATDDRTRGIVTLVMEARTFAIEELGLDAGESYTSYSRVPSDTLALVLSAAYRDRLAPATWWFPIVGRVPYRGFFSQADAEAEQARLEREGFDTYLRPTAAFSTLGWFADPLLSTLMSGDEVEVVTTVLHELSHNHLFVPGQVTFNESYATWVGRAGAVAFFCTRAGGGPDTKWCHTARARWRDTQRFSLFLSDFVDELQGVYGDPALSSAEKVARREVLFARARESFLLDLRPALESLTFSYFVTDPLNNATLLSRVRYYRDLSAFAALEAREGGLREAVEVVRREAPGMADPFSVLAEGASVVPP